MKFHLNMRTLVCTLIISLGFSSFSMSYCQDSFDIVGHWESLTGTDHMKLTFDQYGFVIIESNGETIGGESFERKGIVFSLSYFLDLEVKPMRLDLTFTEMGSGEQFHWPGIMRIISDDEIHVFIDEDGERPEEFIEHYYEVLKRVK